MFRSYCYFESKIRNSVEYVQRSFIRYKEVSVVATGEELAKAGFKYIGTPYTKMDCQKFVEKCLSDCGIHKDLEGCNTWYRFLMQNGWVGTPEECKAMFGRIPVGAILFIHKTDGKEPAKYRGDGIGNLSHMGIDTGIGEGAIHSSESRGGVCESRFKGKSINGGWNRVGLWKAIDYGSDINRIWDGGDKPVDSDELIVFAQNGGDVKLRQKPSTSCRIYWEVATGTVAERTDEADGWSFIKTTDVSGRRREGWMMSKFLTKPSELGGIVNTNPADDPDPDGEDLNDEDLDHDDGGLADDEKKIMVFEALSDIEKKIAEIYEILGGVG